MLSDSETRILQSYLALAPYPENSFTFDELQGYIFGLAITPEVISANEWLPLIFAGDMVRSANPEKVASMLSCLTQVLDREIENFHRGKLSFPFNIKELDDNRLGQLYEWISGFEEALTLREELWDPEQYPTLSNRKKEELYHSVMTVQGLVDPLEIMEFFETIPDETFHEAFPEIASLDTDRDAQIQLFLLSNLPYAIDSLMQHAQKIEKKRHQQFSASSSGKRSNVIEVDFRRNKK